MATSDSVLSLQFLGGAVIRADGTPLGGAAAHRHRIALLALLATSPGPVSRDKILGLLWPERDEEHGRNLLKVAVHELRKLLGEHTIRTTGDQLSLDASLIHCDVTDFETAMAAKDLEKAVGAYAGPFLDGFYMKDAPDFERWADAQRNRLATVYGGALDQLGAAADQRGDAKAAVQWWRALAVQDPLRADVALKLMRAMANAGDREGAIRHAEVHSTLRQKDFGVGPEPAVAKLASELAAAPRSAMVATAERSMVAYAPASAPVTGSGQPLIGRRATPMPVPVPARRRILMPVAIGGVIAATAIAAAGIAWRARAVPSTTGPSDVVAVVPFRVAGADPSLAYLHDGMMQLMVARIGSDGPLRAVESRSPSSTSGEMSVAQALDAARAAGAGQVLLGEVTGGGAGGSVDLAATLYKLPKGEVIARATRTAVKSTPIALAADTLAAELMSRAAGESEDRIADLRQHPLQALRTYLTAQQSYRTGRYTRAESLFAKALDIDSTFALAGMGLALANSWNSINEHYGIGRDAALRNMSRLGARDRAFVTAFFNPDPALGQPKPAPVYLQAWEELVHKYPDFAEAWYHLGDRYYHFGGLSGLADPLDQARTAFRRALTLDPMLVAPLHHLIEIYASGGEKNEAKAVGERYFAENPGVSRDASAIGWTLATVLDDKPWLARVRGNYETMSLSDLARIAWITQANGWDPGDADHALSVFEKRAGPTYEHSNALALRYAFALNAGQSSRATEAARAFEAQLPDQPIAALWGSYASMFGGGDTTHEADDVKLMTPFASAPLSGNPDRRARQLQAQCLVGYWKARHGDAAGAASAVKAVLDRIIGLGANDGPGREGRMCAAWLSAAIAVDAHRADASRLVLALDTMVLRDRVPPRMPLTAAAIMSARLHAQLGQMSQALAASRWREHYTGDPVFLSTQLRHEGDLAARAGDRPGALRAYRHFLALRPAPEAGIATEAATEVRQRLPELDRR